MPLPTISVLNGGGTPTNVPVNNSGRQPDADSASVALSAEGIAAINAITAAITALLNATATEANQDAMITLLDTLGTLLAGVLTVQFATAQNIAGTVDAVIDSGTFPGYKPGDNVTVVDGSARVTRVPRHTTSTGSAVQAAAANANRTYLEIYNGSDTDIWYRYDGVATIGGAGSIKLRPDDREVFDGARVAPTQAISTICGVAGKVLSVWEG